MAGKNTYRKGRHPSQDGALIESYTLRAGNSDALERALGRTLTELEHSQVEDWIAMYRHLRELHHDDVTRQDVKRTLKRIGKLSPDDAAKAFAECDEQTRGEIETSIVKAHGTRDVRLLLAPSGEIVQAAAAAALARLDATPSPGGRGNKDYLRQGAAASQNLWRALGCSDKAPVAWTQALLGAVEGREMDCRKVQRLRAE